MIVLRTPCSRPPEGRRHIMGSCVSLLEDEYSQRRGSSRHVHTCHSARYGYNGRSAAAAASAATTTGKHRLRKTHHRPGNAATSGSPAIGLQEERSRPSKPDQTAQIGDEVGTSSKRQEQAGSSAVMVEAPTPPGSIPSLELLGCEAFTIIDDPLLQFYPDSELITFYEVTKDRKQKAKLGVYTNPEGRLQLTRL